MDSGVLVIRRIHVDYELEIEPNVDRDAIERSHDLHRSRCPVARSIEGAIEVSTAIELKERTEH